MKVRFVEGKRKSQANWHSYGRRRREVTGGLQGAMREWVWSAHGPSGLYTAIDVLTVGVELAEWLVGCCEMSMNQKNEPAHRVECKRQGYAGESHLKPLETPLTMEQIFLACSLCTLPLPNTLPRVAPMVHFLMAVHWWSIGGSLVVHWWIAFPPKAGIEWPMSTRYQALGSCIGESLASHGAQQPSRHPFPRRPTPLLTTPSPLTPRHSRLHTPLWIPDGVSV